jgi:hypothetical protein
MAADITLFALRQRWIITTNDAGRPPGHEFMGLRDGHYWQRRTPGRVEDGFGEPAGELHGPFRSARHARLDLMMKYKYRAAEQLAK